MIPERLRVPVLFVVAVLIFLLVGLVVLRPAAPVQASTAIPLTAPTFQDAANPQEAAALAAIADEAGIAAYFNAGSQIDLATVRNRYRTIEAETSTYIIGSIDVQDYPERFDVHAYVHRDGWFMVYYLAADPASKMVDLVAYTGGTQVTTIFEEVLTILSSDTAVLFTGATFWDFRYPNANRLMIIAEDLPDGNTFTVKLPSSYIFFERSWAAEGIAQFWNLNDTQIIRRFDLNPMAVGTLTAAQMLPDITYTVSVGSSSAQDSGALVLVYRVP